ncbi:MAG: hypothetical protein ACOYXB_05180 [Bacteroidota bacterium]
MKSTINALTISGFFLAALIFIASCDEKINGLPVKTSFGNLVCYELVSEIRTTENGILPGQGKIICLLTFSGDDTLTFNTPAYDSDIRKAFPSILESVRLKAPFLIEKKTGIRHTPLFIGEKDSSDYIIRKNSWGIQASFHNNTWEGILISPGEIVLVYHIPETHGQFLLSDTKAVIRIH